MRRQRTTAVPPALDPGRDLTERIVELADGRRLRAISGGDKSGPLVVFEAGLSAPAASWVHTQREVSAQARTLSYDRAGYGGSDVDPHERTLERIVDDLTALLDALGETSPVVLVGHSWGGPIIRLFADRHPERVAALVFVDATVAESMTERSARLAVWVFRAMSVLVHLGFKELIVRLNLPHGFSAEIGESDRAIMIRDFVCAPAMRAARREAAQIIRAIPTMRRLQAAGTPDVPTVCLQGGRVDRGMATTRPLLNETAAQLMSAAPEGRVVIVDQAGHAIPQECPAVVRDVILEVVEAVEVTQ